jgi:hypothetical protein
MVIELARRSFFVNCLTDGGDKRRKVEKREIGDLRSIDVIAGNGLQVGGYALRVTSYGVRVGGYEMGVAGCRLRAKKDIERVAKHIEPDNKLIEKSVFLTLCPLPHALCFTIPNSAFPLPWPRPIRRRSYVTPNQYDQFKRK